MFLKKIASDRFRRLMFIGIALFLVILYDISVWNARIGFGFLLWVVASLAFLTLTVFRFKKDRQKWAILFTIPIITLAIDIFIYQNTLVTYVVPAAILLLSLFFIAVYAAGNPNRELFLFRAVPLIRSIDLPFLQWSRMYSDVFRWREDARKDTVRKVMIGIVIALPLIILFGWLFARADEVFRDWLIGVIDIDWVDVWRLLRTIVFTIFLGSILYSILKPDYIVTHKDTTPKRLDTIVVSIVLFLINVLFGIFVFFQFKYFFGGSEALIESGLTYAEYARKGFFELCWVIGLAALMLLIIYRSFVFYSRSWLVTILQTLLIAQVGVIAASALKRMELYQEAFGYTVLRLYVEWFLYFVLVVLVFAGIALITRLSFRWFLYSAMTVGLVSFTFVCTVNVEAIIAKENIRRFVDDGETIDFQYLTRLSADSVSAYLPFADLSVFNQLNNDEQHALYAILENMEADIAKRDTWKELHLGSIRSEGQLRFISTSLAPQLREMRLRQRNFDRVESVIQSRRRLDCQSFDEQPARDIHPNSTFECVYKVVDGVQYVYVLGIDSDAASMTVIDVSNKRLVRNFELPTGIKKYTLLPDSRLVEINRHDGTHHVRAIVHEGNNVRLLEPTAIDTLVL